MSFNIYVMILLQILHAIDGIHQLRQRNSALQSPVHQLIGIGLQVSHRNYIICYSITKTDWLTDWLTKFSEAL